MERIPLIAGNGKMNLSLDDSVRLVNEIGTGMSGVKGVEVLVAPPFTALSTIRQAIGNYGIFLQPFALLLFSPKE